MKLYKISKTTSDGLCILHERYVTEQGLKLMGATIRSRGRSIAIDSESQEIVEKLARGEKVLDPYSPGVFWFACCLGSDFSYCSGILFPTKRQVDVWASHVRQ